MTLTNIIPTNLDLLDCVRLDKSPGKVRRVRPSTLHVVRSADQMHLRQERTMRSEQQTDIVKRSNGNNVEDNPRKDSTLSLLNRVWKSDESTKRPTVSKMATLDVPGMEGGLMRQLSLTEVEAPPTTRKALLSLTTKQKKLLKSSFMVMYNGGTFSRAMENVFRRIEAKCPDTRSIFLTTAFVNSLSRERHVPVNVRTENDHCKCVVEMFEQIISHLDSCDVYLLRLRDYGERHAQMRESGFTGVMIESFGEIAVSIIGAQEAVKYNHDTTKAWRLLLAFITDEMKVGFDRYSRMAERRNSSQCPYKNQQGK